MLEKTPSPGDFIREGIDSRGWTQADLARILDRPLPTVNRIIQGKHAVTPEMAIALGEAFGNGPGIWMQREASYRLSLAPPADETVRRRARLYDIAPVKEMEKRQWINSTDDAVEMESELKRFFGVESLESIPDLGAVARKSDHSEPMSSTQRAWCYRVRQLARSFLVSEYKESRLEKCEQELRRLAAYPNEAAKVSQLLSSYGIRCVIVEPLPGCKVDGIAMWLDPSSPVIGLSLRYDRLDAFWFTLCHEWSHIKHRDESPPVDADISSQMMMPTEVKSPVERRADEEAATMLIPKAEIDSFVARVGPLYSKDKIIRFAHRIKIHPGIIVGQLQHRNEIGYSANREMLSKIRGIVTPSAIVDGWGYFIDQGALS